MPYITPERRVDIVNEIETDHLHIDLGEVTTAGELNFAMSALANAYLKTNGLSYQTIAEVGAAFDLGGKEFYRIVAVPYENMKMALNGVVYGPFEPKR